MLLAGRGDGGVLLPGEKASRAGAGWGFTGYMRRSVGTRSLQNTEGSSLSDAFIQSDARTTAGGCTSSLSAAQIKYNFHLHRLGPAWTSSVWLLSI